MEDNGYVDASHFVKCQLVGEDEAGCPVYAGAMCDASKSGSRIKIGIYSDEACTQYDETKKLEDYLFNSRGYGMKFSYHLWRQTYPENRCVVPCHSGGDDEKQVCTYISSVTVACKPPNSSVSEEVAVSTERTSHNNGMHMPAMCNLEYEEIGQTEGTEQPEGGDNATKTDASFTSENTVDEEEETEQQKSGNATEPSTLDNMEDEKGGEQSTIGSTIEHNEDEEVAEPGESGLMSGGSFIGFHIWIWAGICFVIIKL